jgi:pyruvate dehydrogenase E1 component
VISVTSWSELARDGHANARRNRTSRRCSAAASGPIVAASDYVRAVPESIRAYVPGRREFVTLGTDGFGRSDTRAALRQFFGVDAASIADAARAALIRAGRDCHPKPTPDATR